MVYKSNNNIRGELLNSSERVLFDLELAKERGREGGFLPTEVWDFLEEIAFKIVHEG